MNTPRQRPVTVITPISLKNYPSATWLQYALLGFVSIILEKFYEILTKFAEK